MRFQAGQRVWVWTTGSPSFPPEREYARVVTGNVVDRRAEGVGPYEPHVLVEWDGTSIRTWLPVSLIEMEENRAPRKLPIVAGRFAPGRSDLRVVEHREPTTNYPKAGESVQPHVIALRFYVQEIVAEVFAAGIDYREDAGMMRMVLDRPITAADYYNVLIDAYQIMGRTLEQARQHMADRIAQRGGKGEGLSPTSKQVKIGKLSMLGETSKMGCYSFNIPPGPVFQGGTCPASELGFMMQTDAELRKQQARSAYPGEVFVPDFICNGCYAIKGAYGNPSQVFAMELKKVLVNLWLKEGSFADHMVTAIEAGRHMSRARRARLPSAQRWAVPHPDFFRIHDAGDMYSPKYTEGWFEVCRRLPDVNFWAPTRMWALKGSSNKVFARGVPDNLALRPSSIHFGEAPPPVIDGGSEDAELLGQHMPGLSAGAGSGSVIPAGAWECPAYEHVTRGGGTGPVLKKGVEKQQGGTCARAHGPDSPFRGGSALDETPDPGHGCRACWLHKGRPIFYHEH
jgi:hypothetical protein